jgi:beta-lactamase regulating signal transducer with metallopeptidase domain
MASYFITNIVIFLSCLLTISVLVNAPARLKFYLYIISLASWLVPWSALFSLLKTGLVTEVVEQSRLLTINIYSLDYILITLEYYIQSLTLLTFKDLAVVVAFITTVGFLRFILDAIQSRRFHQSLNNSSTELSTDHELKYDNPKNIEIRVGNFSSPGAITGFFKPKIWIDNSVKSPEKLNLVLLHELKHIEQHDHLWMWGIAVIQRLFWWNPIVQYSIRQCKLELELSCDEQCDLALPEKSYVVGLADILINQTKCTNEKGLTLLNIKHSNKFNIKRIERLMVNCRFQTKHLASCLMGLFLCVGSVFSIAVATPMCVSTINQSQNYLFKVTAETKHKNSCPKKKALLATLVITP